MSRVVQCKCCGGSVVYDVSLEASRCIFCGSTEMGLPAEQEASVPDPDAALCIKVNQDVADEQYRSWARASWWTPTELRSLQIDLCLMYIPAWWIRGEVESHWGGLVSAATKSGKAPTSGVDQGVYEDMVPASQGLTSAELEELHPFVKEEQEPWNAEMAEIPFEVPAVSEEAARAWLHDRMTSVHLSDIQRNHGLLQTVGSSMVEEENHKLYMLPVYIGAFRFRERAWRFVINAQTGEVVGETPVDRQKVVMVVGGVLGGLWLLAKASG